MLFLTNGLKLRGDFGSDLLLGLTVSDSEDLPINGEHIVKVDVAGQSTVIFNGAYVNGLL